MNARNLRLCLGLAFALSLASCGKQPAGEPRPAGTAAPAAAPKSATASRAAVSQKADQASDLPSKITRMNEDGSETVEDVPSDSGAHNPLLAAVAATVAASTTGASAATPGSATPWQEGVNYTRLVPAQPTQAPAGQVEVLEFFWYACPHCYSMDPLVEAWRKTKPAFITFSRVPVMWNDNHRSLARLFYTLDALGKLDRLHGEVFKAIHVGGNPLVAADAGDATENEHIQVVFARRFGISEDDFRKAYQSLPVEIALQRADELGQRYRIDGVPTFVVNGKYVADVRSAETPERLMKMVGDLAAQEHKR